MVNYLDWYLGSRFKGVKANRREIRLTGTFLGVAIGDLAENDWLTAAFSVYGVDRDVNACLDGRLQTGQREIRLVYVGDVVERLAAR